MNDLSLILIIVLSNAVTVGVMLVLSKIKQLQVKIENLEKNISELKIIPSPIPIQEKEKFHQNKENTTV